MRLLLFYFSCLLFFSAQSQHSFENKVINPLTKNSIPQEKIFLHTNKELYLSDDTIWFKAYIGDANNKPSFKTSVLRVHLLNEKGQILERKKILIREGMGDGYFNLVNQTSSNHYFIQAFTQNSLNFEDDFVFTKRIRILENLNYKYKTLEEYYDIQIKPEGGYAIENTSGILSFRVLSNDNPVKFSGFIVDENDKVIEQIYVPQYGIGKSKLFYKAGEEYHAKLKIGDSLYTKRIPKPRPDGISLEIDNSSLSNLKVNLRTNEKSLSDQSTNSYTILLHQRNKIFGTLNFMGLDSLRASFIIRKEIFSEGINSITLFENNEPISRRKFFVKKKDKKISVDIKRVRSTKDSLLYKIELKNSNNPVIADLSISVLSRDSEYQINCYPDIFNSFLINPYVDINLERYIRMSDKSSINKNSLDILLMGEEAEFSSLKEIISKFNPRPSYLFENGISLKGRIKGRLQTNTLGLLTNNSRLIDKKILNGRKTFNFNRLLLFKGDTVRFSFIDKNNRGYKPGKIIIDSLGNYTPEFIQPKYQKGIKFYRDTIGGTWMNTKGFNQLEEVNLFGKKRSDKYLRRQKLFKKYKPLVWDIGKYYELGLPETFGSFKNYLLDFLRFEENVELVRTRNNENYLKIPINNEAVLYIDGERVESHELGSVNLEMANVENIMVQPVGRGNRIYQVFTTDSYKNGVENLFVEHIVDQGYDKPKRYSPRDSFFLSDMAIPREIDWKINVKTNEKGEAFIKLAKPIKNETYHWSVQGLSKKGLLIFDSIIN